jgi:hypothetical protein
MVYLLAIGFHLDGVRNLYGDMRLTMEGKRQNMDTARIVARVSCSFGIV